MTFKKLSELIAEMSPEEKEMPVVIMINDEYREMSVLSTITFVDEDGEGDFYPVGQVVMS